MEMKVQKSWLNLSQKMKKLKQDVLMNNCCGSCCRYCRCCRCVVAVEMCCSCCRCVEDLLFSYCFFIYLACVAAVVVFVYVTFVCCCCYLHSFFGCYDNVKQCFLVCSVIITFPKLFIILFFSHIFIKNSFFIVSMSYCLFCCFYVSFVKLVLLLQLRIWLGIYCCHLQLFQFVWCSRGCIFVDGFF